MVYNKGMKILGIETSCDETAAAVVEDGVRILSNVVVSQIDIFAAYGGVIPEVAARSHLEAMLPVIDKALEDAHCDWGDIDAIAVTHAPGLLGSLLVGTLTARTLAILHDKPLYAVHHLKSHVYANWLSGEQKDDFPSFPLLALVVSGGHTQILYMAGHNQFEIIGTTHDDAVGECFDKVAKILGLPYPGGPSISKAASNGDADKYKLPHPKVAGLDFSFSGLKTAVLRTVQKEVGVPISYPSHQLKDLLSVQQVNDFAASFQKTAVAILVEKLEKALEQYPGVKSVVVAGGVSANAELREQVLEMVGSLASGELEIRA
jgi:N6-L-threonylcarbamoyladenine synthase